MKPKNFLSAGALSAAVAIALYFFLNYLPRSFAGEISPDPIFAHIGSLSIRWYGVLIACGATAGYLITRRRLLSAGVKEGAADSIFLAALLGGVVGARAGFVVQNLDFYLQNPASAAAIWQGGLSIHGAIIGGTLGLFFSGLAHKISFLKTADCLAPQLLLAMAIGRFGNFFNQEIVGSPLGGYFWKMYVAEDFRPTGFEQYEFFHPVFLYESLALAAVWAAHAFFRKRVKRDFGFSYTLIAYGLVRVAVEFFRSDYRPIAAFLDLAQLVSLAMVAAGILIIFWSVKTSKAGRSNE